MLAASILQDVSEFTSSSIKVQLTGGCWPTANQTLLLKAALLDAEAALPAWESWKKVNDIDVLEAGTFRLMGLLYRNLVRVGASAADPLLPRLKGLYRNFWTKNQLVLGRKTVVLKALAERGIPCMLLKGAGLTLAVYRDHGVRPMEDFDLMVPRDRTGEVMDLLEGMGWRSEVHAPRDLPTSIHACSFRDPNRSCIDLHWRLCHLPAGEEFDRTLWELRQPLSLHGEPAGVPSITDQLLHTCAHGPQYKLVSPVRWIADAYFLLREGAGQIDWQRIAEYAPAVGAVQGVQGTLSFLRDHLQLTLPEEANRWISPLRPAFQERWESRLLGRSLPSPLHRMPLDFSHHLRCSKGQGIAHRLRGFPVYFRHANNLLPGQLSAHYRARAAYWLRHWLPWYFSRVPRLIFRSEKGSVSGFSEEALQGFHPLEPFGGRTLRWSLPEAGVRLALPAGRFFKISIDVGRLRAWASDLSGHLQFFVNRSALSRACVKGKQGVLTLSVELPEMPPDGGGSLELSWNCLPHKVAGDSRLLGLPVVAIHVAAVKPPKSDPSSPPATTSKTPLGT